MTQGVQDFFATMNPLIPAPPTSTHSNLKINPIMNIIMMIAKEAVPLGRNVSVNKQGICFQSRH